MKIAIITSTHPPYAGGIGNVAAANARQLAFLGHDVTVFTPLYQSVDSNSENYKVVRIKPLFKYGNSAYIPKLKKYLKDFEIIHLHYPFFGGAEVVWRQRKKLKRKNVKIFLHYHMDVVGQGIFKIIFGLHKKLFLEKMIQMSDRVIVTSHDYARHSDLDKFIEKQPDKFFELPNGVDTEIFIPGVKPNFLLEKYAIEKDEKVILFVGGLDKAHYFKGLEYLLEAMERLSQSPYRWRLLIVGQGEMSFYYESLANQYRIHKKTVFCGYVSGSDLPNYYNLADVVVLPSIDKSEAFGMVLVEAMACAKPVIASNLAGVRSVVDDGSNGFLVEPENADDLATKINYILLNDDRALSFGRNGLIKAKAKYSWKVIGQNLEKLYQSL